MIKQQEFYDVEEPDIKTIMVDPCNWKKYCKKCKKWFHITIKSPGTKIASSIPCSCKSCEKKRNDLDKLKSGKKRYYPPNRKIRNYEPRYNWYEIESENCELEINDTRMRTDIKSKMITSTHWKRECPDCGDIFDIFLDPPGLTNREKLPTYCKSCTKNRNKNRNKKPNPQYNPLDSCNKEQMKALASGSVQNLLNAPTRPNPYDQGNSWRRK